MRAFHEGTRQEVKIGDAVTDFRGATGKLVRLDRVRTVGRSGKVTVDVGTEDEPCLVYHYDGVWDLIVTEDNVDNIIE